MRHRKLGRILDEQVNVVILAIHLDKFCLEVSANFGEQPLKSLDSISIEYSMPRRCDDDQVYVHCEDTSVCRGKRLDVLPWTNYDTSVLRVQGYKFETLPNGEQLRNLQRFAGSCRFVYNQALALNKQRYENKEKRLGYAGMCALLPSWKTAHPWLLDAPSRLPQPFGLFTTRLFFQRDRV